MSSKCRKPDVECVYRYKKRCYARTEEGAKCRELPDDEAFYKMSPGGVRAARKRIKAALKAAFDEHFRLQSKYMDDIHALAARCPHKNTQPMPGAGRGDESTACLDCGATGTSPDNIGV